MRVVALAAPLLCLATGCLTQPPPADFAPDPLPQIAEGPATPPRELPGVDTASLSPREKEGWWRIVSRLGAPCPDQAVSVAQCVEEARPCVSCTPLARFLAERVRAGDTSGDAEEAAALRFGGDVRSIDLADSPSKGPASAPVTVVVWGDFECGACARMMPILDELAEKRPNEVRLVHKFYPLAKHPNARNAALAAWAAHRQGKYWDFERKLFADQTRMTDADLTRHARDLGLDLARFDEDRRSPGAEAAVERDKKAADAVGLTGTPHVMVNGRRFVAFEDPAKDLDAWVALELELRRGAGTSAQLASPGAGSRAADRPAEAPQPVAR